MKQCVADVCGLKLWRKAARLTVDNDCGEKVKLRLFKVGGEVYSLVAQKYAAPGCRKNFKPLAKGDYVAVAGYKSLKYGGGEVVTFTVA